VEQRRSQGDDAGTLSKCVLHVVVTVMCVGGQERESGGQQRVEQSLFIVLANQHAGRRPVGRAVGVAISAFSFGYAFENSCFGGWVGFFSGCAKKEGPREPPTK